MYNMYTHRGACSSPLLATSLAPVCCGAALHSRSRPLPVLRWDWDMELGARIVDAQRTSQGSGGTDSHSTRFVQCFQPIPLATSQASMYLTLAVAPFPFSPRCSVPAPPAFRLPPVRSSLVQQNKYAPVWSQPRRSVPCISLDPVWPNPFCVHSASIQRLFCSAASSSYGVLLYLAGHA